VAGRRIKFPVAGGGVIEGTEVQLTESIERWTELKLEDGTVLRVKPVVTTVIRLDQYDPQGNPMYAVQGGQTMVLGSVPDHLRQSANKSSKVQ
jgi:hypothetical protein